MHLDDAGRYHSYNMLTFVFAKGAFDFFANGFVLLPTFVTVSVPFVVFLANGFAVFTSFSLLHFFAQSGHSVDSAISAVFTLGKGDFRVRL